ncbi:MAG: hypothetical protein TECD_00481 [Hyphomicrobiaceae bacterium hypho_1]
MKSYYSIRKHYKAFLVASNQRYCRYAHAITGNLGSMSSQILKEWTSPDWFAKLWSNPGLENSIYISDSETTLELIKALADGI